MWRLIWPFGGGQQVPQPQPQPLQPPGPIPQPPPPTPPPPPGGAPLVPGPPGVPPPVPPGGAPNPNQGVEDAPALQRIRNLIRISNEGLRANPPDGRIYAWMQHQQQGATPQVAGRITRGPADGENTFQALGETTINLLPSILRTVNVAPFTLQRAQAFEYGLDEIILAHHICSARVTGGRSAQRQQAIFELLAPWIPDNLVLDEAASRQALRDIILNNQTMARQHWFTDGMRRRQAENPIQDDGQGAALPLRQQHISHLWNLTTQQWDANTTLTEALEALNSVCQNMEERARNRCMYSVVLLMISFACQGSMSVARMQRIITDLSQTMPGVAESLNAQDIATTWRNFGNYVDDRTIAGVMRRWLELVPQGAIRLRVVLAQAAGSGLTQLDTIARAISEFPDFPWIAFIRLYREQWNAAIGAMVVVGDNPYYGYRRELGIVRSTQYRGLAWACAQLLIELGDQALRNYQGFVEDRRNRDIVRSLVEAYSRTRGGANLEEPLTQEEADMLRDQIPVAHVYAGALVGRASMVGHPDPR